MKTLFYVAVVAATFSALGCSAGSKSREAPGPLICPASDRVMVRDIIYFGRNKPAGGEVSDVEWEAFLAQVVTSRFPAGLTVVHATGQWQGASGAIERERAEVVTLLHAGEADQRRAIGEITGEYKTRFGQEAVLRERTTVCATF